MGPPGDPMAVLDSRLRVRGIEGLRVCDLSAMPNLTAYKARVAARPKVQEALRKEGLAQAA